MIRHALFALAATLLLVGPATADEIRPLTVSPYAGVAMWDADNGLEDDLLFGARLGMFPLNWLGVEGTYGFSPTELNSTPDDDVSAHHVGVDLVLRLLPERRIVPYLSGGWTQVYAKASEADAYSEFNGWEVGGGLDIMMTDRVAVRLDARDVMAKFDPPAPAENDVTHNLLVTAGLSFAFGGGREPVDTDMDGVVDELDDCPQTPAGVTVDARGCPIDSDGDGVHDGLDRCDGPVGAVVDATGCPIDSDRDGVYDGLDHCNGTPAGATIDQNGCPIDSDGDGVYDGLDACPGTPQRTLVDAKGCPVPQTTQEEELLDTGTLQLDDVYFESGSAQLKPESFPALDAVAEILARWPQLRIEIGGHTDSRGAAPANQELSERRAQAVLDYITARQPSIQASQFVVKGYGESQPIADNATEEGRARNRRVVFEVLNPGILKR